MYRKGSACRRGLPGLLLSSVLYLKYSGIYRAGKGWNKGKGRGESGNNVGEIGNIIYLAFNLFFLDFLLSLSLSDPFYGFL